MLLLTSRQSPGHTVVALDRGAIVAANSYPPSLDQKDIAQLYSHPPTKEDVTTEPDPINPGENISEKGSSIPQSVANSGGEEEDDDDDQSPKPMQIDSDETD